MATLLSEGEALKEEGTLVSPGGHGKLGVGEDMLLHLPHGKSFAHTFVDDMECLLSSFPTSAMRTLQNAEKLLKCK